METKTVKKFKCEGDPLDSPQWQRLANQIAREYAPDIYVCAKCQYPVLSGYCCQFCGSNNPRRSKD